MKFFKYRICDRASGWSEWTYIEHFDKSELDYELQCDNNNDGYRGCEIIEVPIPPKEWLQKRIKQLEESIEYARSRIIEYDRLLNQ